MAYDKSGGILFKIDSTNPRAPVYEGNINIVKEDLRELVEIAKDGGEAKMRLVTFRQEGRKGPFLSLALSSWAKHEKERADWKARQNGGGGQQNDDEGTPWDL